MILVTIYHADNGAITGYKINGHSGYAEKGKDIVCSAVSTLSVFPAVAFEEVLRLNVHFLEGDGFAELKLRIGYNDPLTPQVNTIFETFHQCITTIEKMYSKFIKVIHEPDEGEEVR